MTQHTFTVPEMSCGHCTAAITKEITTADTSAQVTCDLGAKTVVVTSTLDQTAVMAALKTAGFDATPA